MDTVKEKLKVKEYYINVIITIKLKNVENENNEYLKETIENKI